MRNNIDASVVNWFSTGHDHFDVTHCDVVSIVASVNGGAAFRNLMIPEFAKELRRARKVQEETGLHLDVTELFYKTHSAVRQHLESKGYSRDAQICELRTTLTKKLSLTKMFKLPKKVAITKRQSGDSRCLAYRYSWLLNRSIDM